jgi:Protein of unknown function (DUF2846)
MMRQLRQVTGNNLKCSEDRMRLSRRCFVFALVVGLAAIALPQVSVCAANAAQTALTNKDIADMHRSGLSADVIIAKIKAGPCSFDTSPAALQGLKAEKVPDNVILAMVNAPVNGKPVAGTTLAGTIVLLHVYRQKGVMAATFRPSIFVDDKQIARMANDSRMTIKLSAGTHTVRSDDKSSVVTVDAKAGQEYYIRVDESAGLKVHGKLLMMTPEQGAPEFKLEKPLEDKDKIARDMIQDDGGGI